MANRKIDAMHREYGTDCAHKCADCPNLCIHMTSKRRYKCEAYGESSSAATDWAKQWTACGLYGKPIPEDHVPLIRRLPRTKQTVKPPDGQMGFLEKEKES